MYCFLRGEKVSLITLLCFVSPTSLCVSLLYHRHVAVVVVPDHLMHVKPTPRDWCRPDENSLVGLEPGIVSVAVLLMKNKHFLPLRLHIHMRTCDTQVDFHCEEVTGSAFFSRQRCLPSLIRSVLTVLNVAVSSVAACDRWHTCSPSPRPNSSARQTPPLTVCCSSDLLTLFTPNQFALLHTIGGLSQPLLLPTLCLCSHLTN